jgi:hypothetical protein
MTQTVATMPQATPPADAAGLYVRNMVALWRWDAQLAMAIDAVPPGLCVATELAKDGTQTARVTAEGSAVYLYSKYRPQQDAQQWASAVQADDKYVVVVNGFGLGYHVKALFDRLPAEALIIVSEPNLGLLRTALACADYSAMLQTGRVLIFRQLDRGQLVDRLEPRSALLTSGMVFARHQPSVQMTPAFHSDFNKQITEFIAFTRTGFLTLMLNNVATCKNIANNIGRYVTTPPIDVMENAFAGYPAILVAAGPSLAKNMHLLHQAKGKAVIIAVQTMLKPLLAAGIEPDFVTSLDYNTVSTRFFEGLDEAGGTGQVHLVAESKANWNVLDVFDGTMSLIHNDFAQRLLRQAVPARKGLKAGATVAHLSFYLAEFLGCEPIILIGQDLGFVDGLYYKPGTAIHETWGVELGRFNTLETKEWERIARSKTILRKIPDIHGHPMYTEEQFFVYLQQFERDFAASRCTVIDATEGGARKEHVKLMTFADAIDRFCTRDLAAVHRPWKQWSCDVRQRLAAAEKALDDRRAAAVDMQQTCDDTVPLLEEMIAKQSDQKRMDELFVQVDRLRSKVGADSLTFEMVSHLNTINEIRRFQHDLAVKCAPEGMERQKKQLERDIDYVKNLRIGCERLLEILDEAEGRLKTQIVAMAAGKAWPSHAAGGKG